MLHPSVIPLAQFCDVMLIGGAGRYLRAYIIGAALVVRGGALRLAPFLNVKGPCLKLVQASLEIDSH